MALEFHYKKNRPEYKYACILSPKYIRFSGEEMTAKKALQHFPDLAHAIAHFKKIGMEANLSGQGPSVYGLSKEKIASKPIQKQLKPKIDFFWSGKTTTEPILMYDS